MDSKVFVIAGLVAVAAALVVFALSARATRRGREGRWLLGTGLLSAGLLALVGGWLLGEPNPNRGEALKTGGLAAGAVVALYALWLNDRRRRVEEDRQGVERKRHDLEVSRAEHDRERVADERFARAVELLGNPAEQVRMGAMHALAGLARNHPHYTQTVLDVLCSYLRRPYDRAERDERERQVRGTAQRLIADLLPRVEDPDAPRYDLDLTGADLEYFDIAERVVGTLAMRFVQMHRSNSFWSCRVHGDAWFTGGVSHGMLYLQNTTFHSRAWFSGFVARGPVRFSGARFHGRTKFGGARFHDTLEVGPSSS